LTSRAETLQGVDRAVGGKAGRRKPADDAMQAREFPDTLLRPSQSGFRVRHRGIPAEARTVTDRMPLGPWSR